MSNTMHRARENRPASTDEEACGWLAAAPMRPHDVDLAVGVRPWTLRLLDDDSPPVADGTCAVAGLPGTRESIAGLFGGTVAAQDVVVTHGIEQAFGLAVDALVKRGDHVVVVTPARREAWRLPRHLGAEVTRVERRPGRPLDTEALAAQLRPTTRAVFLDAAALGADAEAVLALAGKHGTWVVVEEDPFALGRPVAAGYERGVSLGSLASVEGLAGLGWIAFGAAGEDLVLDAVADKAWSTGANAPFLEHRATAVLREAQAHRTHLRSRLAAAEAPLAAFAGVTRVLRDDAAPFAWVPLARRSHDFAEHLLDAHRVLVVPGEAVGVPRTFRIALTVPKPQLVEGLRRIGFALSEHH